MLLASVQVIREQLGFDDMTNINAAIEMALNSVEPQLASFLDTRLERASVTDTFWVPEPGFREGGHVETEFRLSRGFLSSMPTMSVSANPDGSEGRVVTPSKVDLERGVVVDWQTHYRSQYVRITYIAGFEREMTDGDPPKPTGSYQLDQVPTWLQEAATLKALNHLAGAEPIQEAGVTIDTRVIDAQFSSMVNRYQRYAPAALLPL